MGECSEGSDGGREMEDDGVTDSASARQVGVWKRAVPATGAGILEAGAMFGVRGRC